MCVLGFKTKQYSGEIGLHIEDTRFRIGPHGRHYIHDDPVRCDAVLSCSGSHSRYGIYRECGHLVRRMHHGRDDTRRRTLPWHRSYRSME